jgi:hypothetical protein
MGSGMRSSIQSQTTHYIVRKEIPQTLKQQSLLSLLLIVASRKANAMHERRIEACFKYLNKEGDASARRRTAACFKHLNKEGHASARRRIAACFQQLRACICKHVFKQKPKLGEKRKGSFRALRLMNRTFSLS